jgi:thiopurine S-methyltransferase
MEPEFWVERWQRNEIGFHQDRVNPYLERFWADVVGDRNATVFVPLCGKSQDMVWLHERGHTVVGVELSVIAVESFFVEQQLVPKRREIDGLVLFEAQGYKIYCGDYFALKSQHLSQVRAAYDRASLVALPPPLRNRYAQHLTKLLAPGARTLLVAVDYPTQQMQGPPFAVIDAEIRTLYSTTFSVQSVLVRNALEDNPRFKARGLTRLEERVYTLERNNTPAPQADLQ